MNTETLHFANIKCSGCAHSIKTKLEGIEGISDVNAIPDEGSVTMTYIGETEKNNAIAALKKMGYPLLTEENDIITKAKSYASCMIGKISQ